MEKAIPLGQGKSELHPLSPDGGCAGRVSNLHKNILLAGSKKKSLGNGVNGKMTTTKRTGPVSYTHLISMAAERFSYYN